MRLEDLAVDAGEKLTKGALAYWDGTAWRLLVPTSVGDLVMWNGSAWVPVAGGAGTYALLSWNGAQWVPVVGGASTGALIQRTSSGWGTVTPTAAGQLIMWNGSTWTPVAGSAGTNAYLRWSGSAWVPQTPWPQAQRARVYRNSALTLTHNAWTFIAHDTAAENVGSFTFTSNQLRVPADGFYLMAWAATTVAPSSTQVPVAIVGRYSIVSSSGTTRYGPIIVGSTVAQRTDTGGQGISFTDLVYMVAGDWIKVEVLIRTQDGTSLGLATGEGFGYLRLTRVW